MMTDEEYREKVVRGDIAAHKMQVLNSVFTGANLDALYRFFVRQTAVVPDQSYLPILAGLGIAGESGEVVDLLKKVVFHSGHDMDKDRDRLIEEVGDLVLVSGGAEVPPRCGRRHNSS